MRQVAQSRRAAAFHAAPQAGEAVRDSFLRGWRLNPGATVACVWPLPGELDLRPLMLALHERGHPVLLPETPPLGRPLVFRHWKPGCVMVPERFGTMRPDGRIGVPDVVLVPLLAFDRSGGRLGYGGGFYDRTLPTLPGCPAIGVAYAAQEVDSVPIGPHDAKLDAVATERGLIICKPRP